MIINDHEEYQMGHYVNVIHQFLPHRDGMAYPNSNPTQQVQALPRSFEKESLEAGLKPSNS